MRFKMMKIFVLICVFFAFTSCWEKDYLKNKFILNCEEVKVLDLLGKDKDDCLLFKELKEYRDLKNDTVYVSFLFSKKFVSDSTKKEPYMVYPFEGDDGVYSPISSIDLYGIDKHNLKRKKINSNIIKSEINYLSKENDVFKKHVVTSVHENCVKTESFKSLDSLAKEINENKLRVSGESLRHEVIFPVLAKDIDFDSIECEIKY